MGKLTDKIAVISGGNSGIGLAIAQRFVKEGAHVFIFGRRREALGEAAQLIGANVTAIQADATKPSPCEIQCVGNSNDRIMSRRNSEH
jgi:NAD(P)-dependent dehydrogenase (short-subunit alcohol dehydrogenase family)